MLGGAPEGAGAQRRAATAEAVGGSGNVTSPSTSTITDDDIPF